MNIFFKEIPVFEGISQDFDNSGNYLYIGVDNSPFL